MKLDIKIDDKTIGIEKVIPEKIETVKYDIDFLKRQEKAIIEQAQLDTDRHQKELAEVQDLIARAESLGIVAAPDESLII